jgi:hydroxyacylglutathione hydrolase
MFLETVVVGPLQENSYVVACEDAREAVIIDPGAEAERIYQVITLQGFKLKYVLNTHGHIDHIGGVAEIVAKTGVPFLLHEADLYLIEEINRDPLQMFFQIKIPPRPTRFLHDGDIIPVGKLEMQVLHTPGHTPGSVCFLTDKTLFSGDTLFANGVGRTDFPGGSHEHLLQSIREKLFVLDDDVRVYSGHGSVTTIGNERQFNLFL